MEARMKKYPEVSPERAKVRTEKSPKYQQNRKVPVIYYLCRNRHLEHPHFMEVPLSSLDGLYLRDVIDRLNALRGRGMASLYSWSCKRSYKSGFVWHDLCEDDLILPAHGNEYVLKGSELFDESNSDRFSPISNVKTHSVKLLPGPSSSRSHEDASSSSSMNGKDTRHSQEDELSQEQHNGSSDVSPESSAGKSDPLSLALTEYKICKTDGLADASTQTEENVTREKTRKTCTRGVSTEDGSLESECHEICQPRIPQVKDNPEICRNTGSPLPSTSSPSSFGGKAETLESLIRADAGKMNSFRIVEEEGIHMPTNTRMKASNLLMQLISCGSISVKNHSFGLIPNYKPTFSHSKFPSPLFSTSFVLGEFDCLSENPKLTSLRLEDKEYFSGSLVESLETKLKEGNGHNVLKRSSSYNDEIERTNKELKPQEVKEESSSGHSKCIPRSIKASLTKHARSESMRSPVSDGTRNSLDRNDGTSLSPVTSNGSSKRITEPSSGKKQSKRMDSFREEEVIKIEERLASGARVIIQSKPFCETTSSSS
ncbi:PREDICTED: protein UPSTREAM OF FLC-like isoform X1 [Lupinus angustifolius]|uniref:protein UPSTREAM OF FLC-like isoform X1 n=1 Tax=Lupinus angustifolius TaxID=3871 RepID=UPI00092EFC6A|nr:PREDICTED: protein UPSTREAM OF FLC-like isoform X1 [Lupinus angustifolius]XP_019414077.1 PREDICTED: protein UPSTREAM OF FLC-like isoform X1 [Lupinus angustifolius]